LPEFDIVPHVLLVGVEPFPALRSVHRLCIGRSPDIRPQPHLRLSGLVVDESAPPGAGRIDVYLGSVKPTGLIVISAAHLDSTVASGGAPIPAAVGFLTHLKAYLARCSHPRRRVREIDGAQLAQPKLPIRVVKSTARNSRFSRLFHFPLRAQGLTDIGPPIWVGCTGHALLVHFGADSLRGECCRSDGASQPEMPRRFVQPPRPTGT
jgi:hypothetical protein